MIAFQSESIPLVAGVAYYDGETTFIRLQLYNNSVHDCTSRVPWLHLYLCIPWMEQTIVSF